MHHVGQLLFWGKQFVASPTEYRIAGIDGTANDPVLLIQGIAEQAPFDVKARLISNYPDRSGSIANRNSRGSLIQSANP